jgi:hypothetical protein
MDGDGNVSAKELEHFAAAVRGEGTPRAGKQDTSEKETLQSLLAGMREMHAAVSELRELKLQLQEEREGTKSRALGNGV